MSAMFRAAPALRVLSSSTPRYFRTSAPRFLDFNALTDKVGSQEARAELDALRRIHSEIQTKASSVGTTKPIDWAYYAKAVQRPGIVDSFKKASEALGPQVMENPVVGELDQTFAALIKEAEAAQVFSEKQIKDLEAQLTELRTAGDVTELTVKQVAAQHPELVTQIEAEIREHKYF